MHENGIRKNVVVNWAVVVRGSFHGCVYPINHRGTFSSRFPRPYVVQGEGTFYGNADKQRRGSFADGYLTREPLTVLG